MIDARDSVLTTIPDLSKVHLALNVKSLLTCSATLKLPMVHSIRITPDVTSDEINVLAHLAFAGQINLSSLGIVAPFTKGDGVQDVQRSWAQASFLQQRLELILAHQPNLQEVRVIGFSLPEIPPALRELRRLSRLSLIGTWHGPVPD